jgi:transcriptional regulator with XRE-family HTH domain
MAHSPANANFVAELRRLNLTQSEAAERLGVHEAQVNRWFHGRNEPTFQTLKKWSEVFGRTPLWFLEEHEDTGHRRRSTDQPNGDEPVAA